MALSPGTQVGQYAILSLLGRGGMGEVYRARDQRLDRNVAIKVLPEVLATDADGSPVSSAKRAYSGTGVDLRHLD
jgi:serine/threonine protein kinase